MGRSSLIRPAGWPSTVTIGSSDSIKYAQLSRQETVRHGRSWRGYTRTSIRACGRQPNNRCELNWSIWKHSVNSSRPVTTLSELISVTQDPHRLLRHCRAMTTHEQPGTYTPDFRSPQTPGPNEEATVPLPSGPYASYTGTDFPAPPGVPPLAPSPAPAPGFQRPKRRVGALIGGAAMAAVLGAGAGIASYAYLVDQNPSPVNVTSAAAPSPTLDGTVAAAAAKIEPSLVTIAVQASNGRGIGSGMVLDKDGHILTNNHVVAGAGNGSTITVTFHDGTTATAKVIGPSELNDLAVIKV